MWHVKSQNLAKKINLILIFDRASGHGTHNAFITPLDVYHRSVAIRPQSQTSIPPICIDCQNIRRHSCCCYWCFQSGGCFIFALINWTGATTWTIFLTGTLFSVLFKLTCTLTVTRQVRPTIWCTLRINICVMYFTIKEIGICLRRHALTKFRRTVTTTIQA